MKNHLLSFLFSFGLFIVLDLIWFKLFSNAFFYKNLEPIARVKDGAFDLNYTSAIIVYLLLSLGIHFLVLQVPNQTLAQLALKGALFGLITYGVYDFTNHATLKHWPLKMLMVDVSWGAFSCLVVTLLTAKLKSN